MAAEPLPREPLSATCDANGNATLSYRAPTQFYAHAYLAIAVSAGSPSYALTLGGGPGALAYGQGQQTQIGPILLQPGERLSIIVTGAIPSATVSGQILGWQAAQPDELLPLLPLQPTAVTLLTTGASWTQLFAPATPGQSATINVPVGATGARVSFASVGTTGTITIKGAQTGATLFSASVAAGAGPAFFSIAGDSQLTITNAGTVATTFTFLPPTAFPPNIISLVPNKEPLKSVNVLATNAIASVITHVTGQTIYLFEIDLTIDATAAGLVMILADTTDDATLGTELWEGDGSLHSQYSLGFWGAPLPLSRGLLVKSANAGSTIRMVVTYSQG